jgi:benzene/toluene dioxygenase ferredoxin subunit
VSDSDHSAATQLEVDVSDLDPGHTRAVQAGGRKILLCNVGGEYFAVAERCSHAAFSLAGGRMKGFLLECPLHGACFDVRDGSPARRPAIKPLDTYPLRRSGTQVRIELDLGVA